LPERDSLRKRSQDLRSDLRNLRVLVMRVGCGMVVEEEATKKW
jgi:hypothetical protein